MVQKFFPRRYCDKYLIEHPEEIGPPLGPQKMTMVHVRPKGDVCDEIREEIRKEVEAEHARKVGGPKFRKPENVDGSGADRISLKE